MCVPRIERHSNRRHLNKGQMMYMKRVDFYNRFDKISGQLQVHAAEIP